MNEPHSLIVGGTRGLGRVLAEVLAREGQVVSVLGRNVPVEKQGGKSSVGFWAVDLLNHERLVAVLDDVVERNGLLTHLIFLQRYKEETNKWEGEIETSLTATKRIIEHAADKF